MNKMKKIFLLLFALLFCMGAATTHDPWDGTVWIVTSPNNEALVGNTYKEIYDLRKGVALRIDREHVDLATSSVGGEHVQGSARAWFQDAAPSLQPDGTALAAGDLGMLWFDSNATPDNLAYVLTATTPTWTLLSASLSGEAFTWTVAQTFGHDLTLDDGTTDSPALTLIDATDEEFKVIKKDNGNTEVTIPADTSVEIVGGNLAVGDGSPGTAAMDGEDAYIEGALEVDGVATLDGNVTVGGTLVVTGVSTLATLSAFEDATAPTDPCHIANMAYVDAQVAAYAWQYVGGSATISKTCGGAGTFEDGDLSAVVGSNRAMVFLRFTSSGASYVSVRGKGDTTVDRSGTTDYHGINHTYIAANVGAYLMTFTDTSGVMQWQSNETGNTISITVMAYCVLQ